MARISDAELAQQITAQGNRLETLARALDRDSNLVNGSMPRSIRVELEGIAQTLRERELSTPRVFRVAVPRWAGRKLARVGT